MKEYRISYIRELLKNLDKKSKKKLGKMYALTLATSIAEMLSLGAIVPFLAVISNPQKAGSSRIFNFAVEELHFINRENLLISTALIFALTGGLAGILRTKLLKKSISIANEIGVEIGKKIFKTTLEKPYTYHQETNSSELISAVTQKTNTATTAINSIVTIINSATIFLTIYIGLLIINLKIALISSIIFGGSYFIINKKTRNRIKINSKNISENQTKSIKITQESLGNIREIILDKTQEIFIKQFVESNRKLREAMGENQYYSFSPRFIIEAIGIILISTYTIAITLGPSTETVLTTLGALALGAQRLIPLLQQAYGNWVVVTGSRSEITEINEFLRKPAKVNEFQDTNIDFTDIFELVNVSYQHSKASKKILLDINLRIEKGDRIGIIGKTGTGKSTLLDLIMGLISPTSGCLYLDGIPIGRKNISAWQKKIAHVPQTMYISDASVAENIAFGIPKQEIDKTRLNQAIKLAGLTEINSQESEIYALQAGERGSKLSGGQKQRICIARALYKNPQVIIFDEATSALDKETEQTIVNSITSLPATLTVIMVAHKTETLKMCNKIYEITDGKVIERPSIISTISDRK